MWIEELKPSSDAVKSFIVRSKDYAVTDARYIDSADSFDSFISRWQNKTLVKEYNQAPIRHGEVGAAIPNFMELADLLAETKASEHWAAFVSTGEQDLEGFEGEDEEEFNAEEELDRAPSQAAQEDWTVESIKAHASFKTFEVPSPSRLP